MLVLSGCDSAILVELEQDLAPFREVLLEKANSGVVFDHFRWGAGTAQGVVLLDEPEPFSQPVFADQLTLWDAVQMDDGVTYLATDEGLWVVDRELYETDLNEAMEGPVLSLNGWHDSLWLQGSTETVRVQGGDVMGLSIDGRTVSGPVYEGDQPGEAWVVLDGFHRVRWQEGRAAILESAPTPWAKRGARSAGGIIWAAQGREISRRTLGLWERFLLPERAMEMFADSHAEVVWIRGETLWYVWRGNVVQQVEDLAADASVLDIDPSGRLLVSIEGRLERWGAGYSALLKGLSPGSQLEGETEVHVVPSFSEQVDTIEAAINGDPLEDFQQSASIEPVSLGDGAHEFKVTVTYLDGEKIEVFTPFTVGEFGIPTWEDDMLPIFERYCGLCHDGDSESVLNTVDSWRERIDSILKYIAEGTMPPQNDATWVPVSAEEVALVRAWRATGMTE